MGGGWRIGGGCVVVSGSGCCVAEKLSSQLRVITSGSIQKANMVWSYNPHINRGVMEIVFRASRYCVMSSYFRRVRDAATTSK